MDAISSLDVTFLSLASVPPLPLFPTSCNSIAPLLAVLLTGLPSLLATANVLVASSLNTSEEGPKGLKRGSQRWSTGFVIETGPCRTNTEQPPGRNTNG